MGNEKKCCNNCNQKLMGCTNITIKDNGVCDLYFPIPKPEASLRKTIEELCWNVHCDKLLYTKATDQILELAREKVIEVIEEISHNFFNPNLTGYQQTTICKDTINKVFGKE